MITLKNMVFFQISNIVLTSSHSAPALLIVWQLYIKVWWNLSMMRLLRYKLMILPHTVNINGLQIHRSSLSWLWNLNMLCKTQQNWVKKLVNFRAGKKHYCSFTFPRCYIDTYINSFFLRKAILWSFLAV